MLRTARDNKSSPQRRSLPQIWRFYRLFQSARWSKWLTWLQNSWRTLISEGAVIKWTSTMSNVQLIWIKLRLWRWMPGACCGRMLCQAYLQGRCSSSSLAICPTCLCSHSPTQSHPASAGAGRGRPSLSHLSNLKNTRGGDSFTAARHVKMNLGDANIESREWKQNGTNVKGAVFPDITQNKCTQKVTSSSQHSGSSYIWHPRQLTYVYCKAASPGIGAPNRGSGIKEDTIVLNRQLGSWELAKCCCLLSLLSGNKAIFQTIVGGKLFLIHPLASEWPSRCTSKTLRHSCKLSVCLKQKLGSA